MATEMIFWIFAARMRLSPSRAAHLEISYAMEQTASGLRWSSCPDIVSHLVTTPEPCLSFSYCLYLLNPNQSLISASSALAVGPLHLSFWTASEATGTSAWAWLAKMSLILPFCPLFFRRAGPWYFHRWVSKQFGFRCPRLRNSASTTSGQFRWAPARPLSNCI